MIRHSDRQIQDAWPTTHTSFSFAIHQLIFLSAGLVEINSGPRLTKRCWAAGHECECYREALVSWRYHLPLLQPFLSNFNGHPPLVSLISLPHNRISNRLVTDCCFGPDASLPDFCLSSSSLIGTGQIPIMNL